MKPTKKRWSRVLVWLLLGLGAIVGLVVIVGAAAFAFALTEPGERALKRALVSQVDESIAGTLSIDELEFRGDELELFGVNLLTPERERVASLGRVLVDVSLRSLLRREIRLERLLVSEYDVELWQRDGQWNLARATAPTKPAAPREEPWARRFGVDDLDLSEGVVLVSFPSRSGEARQVRLRDLEFAGHASYRDDRLQGDVRGRGQVVAPIEAPLVSNLRAAVDRGRQSTQLGIAVGERELSLAARLPEGATLAELPRANLDELEARLYVNIPEFESEGFSYGPVHFLASVARGRFDVPRAQLEWPGLRLSRDRTPEGDGFAATLHIESLATALQALASWTGRPTPALSGRGRVSLHVENPLAAPDLDLDGRLPELLLGDLRAHGIRVELRVENLLEPAQARVALDADSVVTGTTRLSEPRLRLEHRRDRSVSLDAESGRPYAARLVLRGRLDEARRNLDVRQLALSYPDTSWAASGPARIGWGDGATRIDGLELVSGAQRLGLDVNWGPAARQAHVTLANVDLGSLPEPLLGERPVPSGVLSGELRASQPGDAKSLTARADLKLSNAAWSGLRGVTAELDASYAAERARGTFSARALSGTARGSFDVPTRFPPARGTALDAQLDVQNIELAQAWEMLQRDGVLPAATAPVRDLTGRLEAALSLEGTWPEPDVALTFELREGGLRYEGQSYRDVTLLAAANRERLELRRLSARTATGSIEGKGDAQPIGKPAGEDEAWRYQLQLAARRFSFPLDTPLLADFQANVEGTATPDRVQSEIAFENVRVLRATPTRKTGALLPSEQGIPDPRQGVAGLERGAASGHSTPRAAAPRRQPRPSSSAMRHGSTP